AGGPRRGGRYTCFMESPAPAHFRPIGLERMQRRTGLRHRLAAVVCVLFCASPAPVQAWREDPRPAADTPAGVERPIDPQSAQGRRGSRRSQRRGSRRRQPLDELPIEVAPTGRTARDPLRVEDFDALPETTKPPSFARDGDSCPVPAAVSTSAPPIPTDTTLSAPFQSADAQAAGVTTHRDQPYGEAADDRGRHGRQRFDLHLPAGCNGGGMPLVVWIHGDSWRDGSKADCPIVWLANQGYAVASIGYRLSDTAVFPAQLEDCREAVAEIERNAEIWGIDRSRVAVVGSGGGGHLAALVGLASPAAAAAEPDDGDALPRIAAVCAVAAPSSLTTLGPAQDRAGSPASRLVGGPLPEFREAAQRASPITHVSADDPPILLVHGAADGTVPVKQSIEFDAALRAAGVDSTLVILAGSGHGLGLDPGTPGGLALIAFLDRVLGAGVRTEHAPRP
ncbi:MAG: alpha/beta hydrolase fold domain-containing protein, partial [Planctomycetia bacterium]